MNYQLVKILNGSFGINANKMIIKMIIIILFNKNQLIPNLDDYTTLLSGPLMLSIYNLKVKLEHLDTNWTEEMSF